MNFTVKFSILIDMTTDQICLQVYKALQRMFYWRRLQFHNPRCMYGALTMQKMSFSDGEPVDIVYAAKTKTALSYAQSFVFHHTFPWIWQTSCGMQILLHISYMHVGVKSILHTTKKMPANKQKYLLIQSTLAFDNNISCHMDLLYTSACDNTLQKKE